MLSSVGFTPSAEILCPRKLISLAANTHFTWVQCDVLGQTLENSMQTLIVVCQILTVDDDVIQQIESAVYPLEDRGDDLLECARW